jgi:multiple sugar transport system permease protein
MNRRKPRFLKHRMLENFLLSIALFAFVISVLSPVAWLLISSVSSTNDLTNIPLRWLPQEFDFSRYTTLLFTPNETSNSFLAALRNSLLITLTATIVSILAAIPGAYSFSRFPGPRANLLYVVLGTYMIPPIAIVLPLYAILARVHLLNTISGMVLVYCTILTPFATWLLKTNFDAVPLEIEESAQLDGLSRWVLLLRITVPLALPGLSTAAVWAVLIAWDEFFYALLFTSNVQAKTLTVTIADFAAGRAVDYGLICAAGALAALPPILIGFLLQRGLMSGLTAGSVKG